MENINKKIENFLGFILFYLLKKSGLNRNSKVLNLDFKYTLLNKVLRNYLGNSNYHVSNYIKLNEKNFDFEKISKQDFIIAYDLFSNKEEEKYHLKLLFKNIDKICNRKTKVIISIFTENLNLIESAAEFNFKWTNIKNHEKDLYPYIIGHDGWSEKLVFLLKKQ